jgi:hypothetical protein
METTMNADVLRRPLPSPAFRADAVRRALPRKSALQALKSKLWEMLLANDEPLRGGL